MNSKTKYIIAAILFVVVASCQREPKVVTVYKENGNTKKSTGIFSRDSTLAGKVHAAPSIAEDMHTVIAKKVVQSTKYMYVFVQEDENEYWIATTKQEVRIDNVYFYRDGLLKTNFESKELNKTFQKIYFVSKFVPADHGNTSTTQVRSNPLPSEEIVRKGSVKIATLFANPKKYSGKTIQVSGKCVRLNENIMGRNWIHLNDGSTKKNDLIITSEISVPVGNTITMTGTVLLDKDFGAGYRYDILLENGMLIK